MKYKERSNRSQKAIGREKKILFLSPYPINKAPSQRLKYEQYYPLFEEEGFRIFTSSFMDEKLWDFIYRKGFFINKFLGILRGYLRRLKDLFRISEYDIVYVHLWVTPIGNAFFEFLVRRLAKKMIYDIDDMIFLGHSSNANSKLSFLKGKLKTIYLIKYADHVISCTPKLDEFVRRYNSKSTDISSTIDTDIYLPKKDYQLHSPIIIGWSGSHSTSKYLHLLRGVLVHISKEHSIILKVIGDASFVMEDIKCISREWNVQEEVEEILSFDIGLYPLPKEEWVYGKSGLKALQYMALGIPTVATDIGANSRIIENAQNGYLVNSEEDWVAAIEKIIGNIELRKRLGENARRTVEEKFSLKANKEKYVQIFNTVIHQ